MSNLSACAKNELAIELVPSSKKKFFIKTFGCQMNEYDSLKIAKILEQQYSRVETPEEAELILINTCSVREKGEHKLFSLLGEMRELKEQKPDLVIGVGGCVAQQEGVEILRRSSLVNFVFGTHNLSLVPSLINLSTTTGRAQVAVDYRDEWEDIPLGFPEPQNGEHGKLVSVFVAISRGCNKNCTFCIVPTTRGPEVSRDLNEIEREVRLATRRGAREVTFLGQTVNSYGRDLNPRLSFTGLLERVSKIDGLERIRFTSPHPQEVGDDFIDFIGANSKVCKHIHMPLQSGSDRILKAMNRNYRRARYLKIIERLKRQIPDISITTDVIVGFPGETEEDFQETLEVLQLVEFDNSYSFVFSPRPGTPAALLTDTLPVEGKLQRLYAFQQQQEVITRRKLNDWTGKSAEVLIDRQSAADETILQGRISQNIVVNLNASHPDLRAGMFVDVKITEPARYTLKADLLNVLRN